MKGSEYEPLFAPRGPLVDDLEPVRSLFAGAARPFTRSPWPWFAWALLLPAAALTTRRVAARFGPSGAVICWCGVILVGGLIEMWAIRRGGRVERTTLAGWVLRSQANLSFLGVALSAALVWHQRLDLLPGLWLLVLGHSFLVMGGLAFRPFRRAGVVYQVAGLAALWPGQDGLLWLAAAAALGNLSIALAVRARGRV